MSLNVSIRLNIVPLNPYQRGDTRIKGTVAETILAIAEHINITNYEADHDRNIADIGGSTQLTLPQLTNALYGNEAVASRIKTLATNYDLLAITSTPQQRLPTEEEIRAQQLGKTTYTCSADPCYVEQCPVHG